jgi:hypothetical protein
MLIGSPDQTRLRFCFQCSFRLRHSLAKLEKLDKFFLEEIPCCELILNDAGQ